LNERLVDFSPAMPLPSPPRGLNSIGSAFLGWLGNQHWALISIKKINDNVLQKMIEKLDN
jgi:hypothetical protein